MENRYRICSKTVMDTVGDPDITFDANGVSNYYYEFTEKLKVRIPPPDRRGAALEELVRSAKRAGRRRRYDCVIGVSGGVDSSYVAWLVRRLGLRPLAVHLDNGWDSEVAVRNIYRTLEALGIDLHTEVLDWEMFRDLQLSFLKASTPDGEIPTDHAILAAMYRTAARFGIRYIFSGQNFRYEGMLPPSWAQGFLDWRYIRGVHKRFGTRSLKSFPHMTVPEFIYYNTVKGIRNVSILNYVDFNKPEAVSTLKRDVNWEDYGGKHHESIYTRFYQSYILPEKFSIDKRKAHLTCMIISTGEVTREEALEALRSPPASPTQAAEDRRYVIMKLGITDQDFDGIMNSPIKSIRDYPNHRHLERGFRRLLLQLRERGLMPN